MVVSKLKAPMIYIPIFELFWKIVLKVTMKSLKIPKGVIRIRKNQGQTTQWPQQKGQTTIYETLCRKLKIEQHKPH